MTDERLNAALHGNRCCPGDLTEVSRRALVLSWSSIAQTV